MRIGKALPRGTFAAAGGGLGTLIGGPTGGAFGTFAGNLLSRITGMGDYTMQKPLNFPIQENTIISGHAMPMFAQTGNGVEISHREFVADISGSVAFTNTSFEVNPGNETLFPWLAQVAHYFEEYSFKGLVFEYRPSSGYIGAATPNLGVVMMATNYNCDEPSFETKVEIDSYEYATSCVPNQAMIHPVECKPSLNPLNKYFVRTADSPDAKLFYDLGKFQIATKGMQSAYACGELWVSYHVALNKPRLNVRGPSNRFGMYNSSATCTAANPLNAMVVTPDATEVGAPLTFPSSTTMIFHKAGDYLFTMQWDGATITGTAGLSLGSNLSALPFFLANPYVSAEAVYITTIAVAADGTGAANTATVTGLATMTAGTCYVTLSEIPKISLTKPVQVKATSDVQPVDEDIPAQMARFLKMMGK